MIIKSGRGQNPGTGLSEVGMHQTPSCCPFLICQGLEFILGHPDPYPPTNQQSSHLEVAQKTFLLRWGCLLMMAWSGEMSCLKLRQCPTIRTFSDSGNSYQRRQKPSLDCQCGLTILRLLWRAKTLEECSCRDTYPWAHGSLVSRWTRFPL